MTTPALTKTAFRHLPLGDVGSTNTEALKRARAGEASGLWITADRQLDGRGRRGRPWTSESGNLYASLLLIDPAPITQLGSLPLVVAIAVHNAIAMLLPPDAGQLAIKWPNDILINGAKTCGILLESEVLPDGSRAVVAGCGVNIAHHPARTDYASTRLNDHAMSASPQEFFARLFVTMEETLNDWDSGRGLSRIRAAWLERAAGVGQPITVRLPDSEISGLFKDIDADGRLILALPDGGTRTFAAGDVFFPAAASRPDNPAEAATDMPVRQETP
ncbi:biotin--[acetyl-CoA-carboxylase] ligase [Pseudohoeflea coraliihabitans]|uniref:biotin--[acetyl-CoA-carboxylase] ligase n=1 Tax=Pseudohoeflea coraliihabitans TaxID=2860393 RepID=UPI003204B8A7